MPTATLDITREPSVRHECERSVRDRLLLATVLLRHGCAAQLKRAIEREMHRLRNMPIAGKEAKEPDVRETRRMCPMRLYGPLGVLQVPRDRNGTILRGAALPAWCAG